MASESLSERLMGQNLGDNEAVPPSFPTDSNDYSSNVLLQPLLDAPSSRIEELRVQLWIAGPMMLVNILQYSLNIVSLMFVGHLGRLELASASIAYSFAAAMGYHFMIGLASGLETLSGQAFGAKEFKLCGIYLQRAILLLTVTCIPVSFLFWNMGSILLFIGQDADIAASAGLYARYLLPSVFAYACLQPLVQFLQTQSVVTPMTTFATITLILHILLCYGLVNQSDLGLRGAAIANGISQWINVLLLVFYIKFAPSVEKSWGGLSSEAFHDLWGFLKLAIPAAIMICLEYWSLEFLVIISGLLPNPELESSTLSICTSAVDLLYMIPYGLSAAASTRVANELGAGNPRRAEASVRLTVTMTMFEGLLVAVVLLSVRRIWPRLFTNDEAVVDYVASVVPFLAAEVILDAYTATISGVARGCGWQDIGAFINLGAYYIVGIPTALILAFYFHLNGYGLWTGIICALVVQSVCLTLVTSSLKWEKLAEKAQKSLQKGQKIVVDC